MPELLGCLQQDRADCSGQSLLKSFLVAAAHGGDSIHVLNFDVPEDEFHAGFDPQVAARLKFHDGFWDPLNWNGEAELPASPFTLQELQARIGADAGPVTLVLASLSWVLLHSPVTAVCHTFQHFQRHAKSTGLNVQRIIGLLHGDLHEPAIVASICCLAGTVITVSPAPSSEAQAVALILQRRKSRKVVRVSECFTILECFVLKSLGQHQPLLEPAGDEEVKPAAEADPAANLTFNLRLSEEERSAKESLLLPYHLSAEVKSSLLQSHAGVAKVYYEPDAADDLDEEDPDDDLDV
ncbi:elongator complex protein 5 isoform X2 [Rhinatrema bivittatum]|uniref:elongator complex protein 5 isoform X2 n=1 Tax=Rhinatrema bivittatum TaxID=194408 RepID=UPI001126DC72|nr:elongator complex protein 5 isoform X2 [Rhinatrema bivittatum]